jgi:uncharacterized protein (DUF433 family)
VESNRQKRRERANHIAELRRGGATYAEIAAQYQLTMDRIRQIVKSYNETAKNPVLPEEFNHKRPPDLEVAVRREKVAELRRTGLSHQQIAKKMNVSAGVIRQDLEVYNKTSDNPIPFFQVDKRHRINAQIMPEIIKMRKCGVPVSDIAEKYGVVASRIYQVLNEAGL